MFLTPSMKEATRNKPLSVRQYRIDERARNRVRNLLLKFSGNSGGHLTVVSMKLYHSPSGISKPQHFATFDAIIISFDRQTGSKNSRFHSDLFLPYPYTRVWVFLKSNRNFYLRKFGWKCISLNSKNLFKYIRLIVKTMFIIYTKQYYALFYTDMTRLNRLPTIPKSCEGVQFTARSTDEKNVTSSVHWLLSTGMTSRSCSHSQKQNTLSHAHHSICLDENVMEQCLWIQATKRLTSYLGLVDTQPRDSSAVHCWFSW